VLLSQIGNVLCLAGGAWFARVLVRGTAWRAPAAGVGIQGDAA